MGISIALLAEAQLTEFQIRHWIGKAAFACTFRRPLFSVLQEVFTLIEDCKKGGRQALSRDMVDEVISFLVLDTHAQSELRAKVSPVISCTDASPTGGGGAEKFKDKSLVLPEELEPKPDCVVCCATFATMGQERQLYKCPRECGERMCSARCAADHFQAGCVRADFFAPSFGERFSGPRYPLTKACGLAGVGIQRALDRLIEDDSWIILTEEGKERLEAACEPSLKAEHWAPECKTFSRARGRWIQLPDGTWTETSP